MAVLTLAVVGLGLYALDLESSLDDANARIASQEGQLVESGSAGSDRVASAKRAYDDLKADLGVTEDADDTSAAGCARSFLAAFGGVFGGSSLEEGVEATVAELQTLRPQCVRALVGT